ncbi:MAG: TetR family transcriptional regulator [Bacteroidota bacterium]
MVLQTETESKIIDSAEKLFYQKGKAGTSMQDIADDAGINRTLLNYYFRSKDLLFEAVFRKAMGSFVPALVAMMQSDMSFEEYIPQMIGTVIDAMLRNPQIPIFVLQELSSNPERMPQLIMGMGIDPAMAIKKMKTMQETGVEGHPDPRQVILNVLSLCIFPFAARPVVTEILFQGDETAFLDAMRLRKVILPEMIKRFMTQNN